LDRFSNFWPVFEALRCDGDMGTRTGAADYERIVVIILRGYIRDDFTGLGPRSELFLPAIPDIYSS